MRFAEPHLSTMSELGQVRRLMQKSHSKLLSENCLKCTTPLQCDFYGVCGFGLLASEVAMATASLKLVAAQHRARDIRIRKGWVVKRMTATSAT